MQQVLASPDEIRSFLKKVADTKRSGEVLLSDGEASAKLYIRNGLVLWGFASGQRESFQSILLRDNRLEKNELVQGIHEARKQGRRTLDEILLFLGIDDPKERKSIVTSHTQAALSVVGNWKSCVAEFVEGDRSRPAQPLSVAEILKGMVLQLPGCLAVSLIDGRTAMPIFSEAAIPDLNLELASAFYFEITRSAVDTQFSLERASEDSYPLEEIVLRHKEDTVILIPLREGMQVLLVMVKKSVPIERARDYIRKTLEALNAALR